MDSGRVESGKLTRVFSDSALQCCEMLHIYTKDKKAQRYITELPISTSHFSQRHTIIHGGYLTNPQTPYSIKQITSSSPKRTKQAELNFPLQQVKPPVALLNCNLSSAFWGPGHP